jgi:acylphosphatase
MPSKAALKLVVTGLVQGVMFRDFTRRKAAELGLTGYVRNLPGGKMLEVEAEGERAKLEILMASIKQGPPGAVVEAASEIWGEYTAKYHDFRIKF